MKVGFKGMIIELLGLTLIHCFPFIRKCNAPTLTRFVGRYNDLTIKGRLNLYFTQYVQKWESN